MAQMTIGRRGALILALGLLLCLGVYALFNPFDSVAGYMPGAPVGRDFINFWLGGRLALESRLDLLADGPRYNELIATLFAHRPDSFIFSYPPNILPFLLPFGLLPYGVALALWSGLNLACMVSACTLTSEDRRLPWLVLLSPAMLMTIIYGHFGGVAGLAIVYLLKRGRAQPWRAGALVALLAIKPQIFVVVCALSALGGWFPVAWRAALLALLPALASLALFGIEPWLTYVERTAPLHVAMIETFQIGALRTTISAYAGARMAGLTHEPAQILQMIVSLALLISVPVLLRRMRDSTLRDLVFSLGALAILPYANHYDLALAAPALTLYIFDQDRDGKMLPVLLWLAPAVAPLAGNLSLPLAPYALMLGTLQILVAAFRAKDRDGVRA